MLLLRYFSALDKTGPDLTIMMNDDDISRDRDRPDRTVGPVRSLATAPVAATGDLYSTINRGEG